MKKHYHKVHNGNLHKPESASHGKVQKLEMTSQFRKIIQVTPALDGLAERDFYSTWYHSRPDAPPFLAPTDPRKIPLWLQRLGWRDFVKPLDVLAIHTVLEARNIDDQFGWVRLAIDHYLLDICEKISGIQPLALGWISTVDG
jgi:hypothetical protein